MYRLYIKIKLFFVYCKNLNKAKKYLNEKYGFNYNLLYEFFTVINLIDIPKETQQQYGSSFAQVEIKKFIKLINEDLPKLELNELVNVYEIKKIDEYNYGIAFGYSLLSNKKIIYTFLICILLIILSIVLLIL